MKKTLALLLAIAATQAIAQRTTYTETYRVGGNQTVPAIRNQGQLTVVPPGTPVMPRAAASMFARSISITARRTSPARFAVSALPLTTSAASPDNPSAWCRTAKTSRWNSRCSTRKWACGSARYTPCPTAATTKCASCRTTKTPRTAKKPAPTT